MSSFTLVIGGPLENLKSSTTRTFVLDLTTASDETTVPVSAQPPHGGNERAAEFNVVTNRVGNFIHVHIRDAMI